MKRLILLLCLVAGWGTSHAQSIIKSVAQTITNRSVAGSIVLVRQSYYLVDKTSGEAYGRNNRDEFGSSLSLGIVTKGGVVLTEEAVNPWKYEKDFDFSKYEQDYNPELIKTGICNIDDPNGGFTELPAVCKADDVDGVYVGRSDGIANPQLEIDDALGEKEGWVVWFLNNGMNKENCVPDISKESYITKLEFTKKKTLYDLNQPMDSDKVIGGVYLNPVYPGGGLVVYKLAGYMVRNEGKWMVRRMPHIAVEQSLSVSERIVPNLPSEVEPVPSDSPLLTPVKKPADETATPTDTDLNKNKPKKKRR